MMDLLNFDILNGIKMKEETLQKPPPLLLPPANPKSNSCSRQYSFNIKERCVGEKTVQKYAARYDAFQGILKRVSEMKLSGSWDSEEPSTGSEKSESSTSVQQKRRVQSRRSSTENRSNFGAFEDESSASSVSDRCSPCEEIPRVGRGNRYSCSSLPPYPAYGRSNVCCFGESFPPAASPTGSCKSNRNSEEEYKLKEEKKRRCFRESVAEDECRAAERGTSPVLSAADVRDDRAKYFERRLSVDGGSQPEGLSESERHQLEMFFRSLKTNVFVCGSLANLYFGWKEEEGNWRYRHTGAVIVVFDSGDTRCRNKRKIQILLAERGTCFPLWKDTIDNLSAYHKSGTAFHTMHLSSDHRQMIGFSFDSAPEADKLLAHLEELTSNPENINISAPGSKKKKKPRAGKRTVPLPHKKNISNPCLFEHVTSVAAKDKPMYMSMQTLIDSESIKKGENIC